MKVLKFSALILLVMFMILFVALPTTFYIKKEIIINQNTSAVFEQVNNLKNWQKWSPWQENDTNMVNTYEGPEEGIGSINHFKSESEGNGRMQIMQSDENKFINIGLFFEGMEDGENPTMETSFSFLEMSENHVQVTWTASDTIGYFSPFRLILPFMTVKLGDTFEKGLKNLKKVCEDMKVPIVDVVLSEGISPKFRLISLKDTTSLDPEKIKNGMNSKIIKIVEYMKANSIKGQNIPFTIQHLYDEKNDLAIYEYGFPLDSNVVSAAISNEFNLIEIGGNYTVSATHTGPLRTINQSHIGIKKYMELKEYKLSGSPYQYYTTNPDEVGEWGMISEVYYPVIKN